MHSLTYAASVILATLSLVNAQSISEVVSAQPNLSTFNTILQQNPALADLIDAQAAQGKTVFAPSNSAFTTTNLLKLPRSEQQAALRYHIVNGTYPAKTFSDKGGITAATFLEGDQYALLGGAANVVFASKFGDAGVGVETQKAMVFTGEGKAAEVSKTDLKFAQGFVHIIEAVFSLPRNCTKTSTDTGLNGLVAALDRTDLGTYVDSTPMITCFAPSDDAFMAAGSPQNTLSQADLAMALKYHTLQGDIVAYTDTWGDGEAKEFMTLANETVIVRRDKKAGVLWVNDVMVKKANVVTSNGVQHVLSGVLNPARKSPSNNTDNTGNGATSSISTPTGTTSPTPSPSHQAGPGMRTAVDLAAMGAAVLGALILGA